MTVNREIDARKPKQQHRDNTECKYRKMQLKLKYSRQVPYAVMLAKLLDTSTLNSSKKLHNSYYLCQAPYAVVLAKLLDTSTLTAYQKNFKNGVNHEKTPTDPRWAPNLRLVYSVRLAGQVRSSCWTGPFRLPGWTCPAVGYKAGQCAPYF